jgi:hypothetical protein
MAAPQPSTTKENQMLPLEMIATKKPITLRIFFCCNGCQTVCQILQNGLCTYYDLNEKREEV